MAIWRRLESWLCWLPWYRRQTRDSDLARELRDHLDLEADEQKAAGLSPERAAYAAHRALGNTLKIEEDVRRAWGIQWLETLVQDLHYGLRMLRKSPGFTAVAILTLALGIGANTAMFSVLYGLVLRPLPYTNASRLVMLWDSNRRTGLKHIPVMEGSFAILQSQAKSFEGMAAFTSMDLRGGLLATRLWGTEERVAAAGVSPQFFSVLGVAPLLEIGRAHV